jgi:hypothetical protein
MGKYFKFIDALMIIGIIIYSIYKAFTELIMMWKKLKERMTIIELKGER